jgi:hypothetical protein
MDSIHTTDGTIFTRKMGWSLIQRQFNLYVEWLTLFFILSLGNLMYV